MWLKGLAMCWQCIQDHCPVPNGDNDTLINTNPSIPIIGKWYPQQMWDLLIQEARGKVITYYQRIFQDFLFQWSQELEFKYWQYGIICSGRQHLRCTLQSRRQDFLARKWWKKIIEELFCGYSHNNQHLNLQVLAWLVGAMNLILMWLTNDPGLQS